MRTNHLTEEKRIIIRIWTSKQNGGENVGHVSIETITPPGYMSLWPSEEGKTQGKGLFRPIDHELKADFEADQEAEQRSPEQTICLYSLDSEALFNKFQSITTNPNFQGWVAIGANRLINQNSGHSCASLTYELLKSGGIYDLLSSGYSSRFSSIVTPDQLATTLQQVKQEELREYPETENYSLEGETSVTVENNRCCIM